MAQDGSSSSSHHVHIPANRRAEGKGLPVLFKATFQEWKLFMMLPLKPRWPELTRHPCAKLKAKDFIIKRVAYMVGPTEGAQASSLSPS